MSQVDLLYRLQQTDDTLRDAKKRLARVITLQSRSQELVASQKQVEETVRALEKWHAQQSNLNLELQSLNDKTKRSEDRLYSGLVKNPKELEDLQREIDSLGRRRSTLEDELLEAMIAYESAQEENSDAVGFHQEVREKWERQQSALNDEQAELVERIKRLTEQRKAQLKIIEPGYLATYENLAKRIGNLVVVELRNHRCTGCQVRVPDNRVKAADEGQLATCDNCGRILCPC